MFSSFTKKKEAAVEVKPLVADTSNVVPEEDCYTSMGNFTTYVTNGDCVSDTYQGAVECPGNTISSVAECPSATGSAFAACPDATGKAFADCGASTSECFSSAMTSTSECFSNSTTSTGECLSNATTSTGECISSSAEATYECVVNCPNNTVECVTNCPQNTMNCASAAGKAVTTAGSDCLSGTGSILSAGCGTIAAIPNAIMDCPAQTSECISNAYDGAVEACADFDNPCADIHIPTTIDECADIGAQTYDTLTCHQGDSEVWRAFIILNRYSVEVMKKREKTSTEKELEDNKDNVISKDWKNAANFNYMVCYAFIPASWGLQKLKDMEKDKDRPIFYQNFSNPNRVVGFKDPIMIDKPGKKEHEEFDVDYIVCEIGKGGETESTEQKSYDIKGSYDFLKNHVDNIVKKWNLPTYKEGGTDLQLNFDTIKKNLESFDAKYKKKSTDMAKIFEDASVKEEFQANLDRMANSIKSTSCFQAESAYAKVVHNIGGQKFHLYAFIKEYKYLPYESCQMTLRFNEKEKQDEFTFTYYYKENGLLSTEINNQNRLLKILPRFHDILGDDAACGSGAILRDDKSNTEKEVPSYEHSGFLYRDKIIYISMNQSILNCLNDNQMSELVRVREDDESLRTKKYAQLDATATQKMIEKNQYHSGLDHSLRYYQCLAVRVLFNSNTVDVGLIAGIDEDGNDDAKHRIEAKAITMDRIFPYDPSNYNIINFPRSEMQGTYAMGYEIQWDKNENLEPVKINTTFVTSEPFVVRFTPYVVEKDDDKKDWCWPEHANAVAIPRGALGKKCFLVANRPGVIGPQEYGKIELTLREMHSGQKDGPTQSNEILVCSKKSTTKTSEDETISNTYTISLAHKALEKPEPIVIVGDKHWALDKQFSMDYTPRVLSQDLELSITVKKAAGVGDEFTFLGKVSLFQFDEISMKVQLIYGNHLLQIPGATKKRHEVGKKDYWAQVADHPKYSISFIHPETNCDNIFSHEQRVTYNYHKELYPGTVKDIVFSGNSTLISVDLDRGDQGRKVQLNDLNVRPDLINENFDETQVFDYGAVKGRSDPTFRKKALGITNKEFNSLQEKKDESWIKLPQSIYGAATCFIIVNHEKDQEIENQKSQLDEEWRSNPNPIFQKQKKRLEKKQDENELFFRGTFFMLLAQIVFTFLMQGILILYVFSEVPNPSDEEIQNLDVYNNITHVGKYEYAEYVVEESGFCTVNPYLQVAAIAVLSIWTVSTFTDIWVELRCYISKALVLEDAETGEFRTLRIDKSTRVLFHHFSFFVILGLETIICLVVFIAGMKYVLNLQQADDIVGGVLAITFVTDIDNKVYEISAVGEGEDSDVGSATFRVTDTDFLDSVMAPIQNLIYSTGDGVLIGKTDEQKEKIKTQQKHREMIKYFVQHYLQIFLSVVLVLFVFIFVFSNRVAYCDYS